MIDPVTAATAVALRCRWTDPGGDSLGVGHEAIWLTDYHAGTISRIKLEDALSHCKSRPPSSQPASSRDEHRPPSE
jgi:hypothetical protein